MEYNGERLILPDAGVRLDIELLPRSPKEYCLVSNLSVSKKPKDLHWGRAFPNHRSRFHGCCIPSWNHFASLTWFVFPYFSTWTIPRSDNAATTLCVLNRDRPASFVMYFCKYVPPWASRTLTILRSSSLRVFRTIAVFSFPLPLPGA